MKPEVLKKEEAAIKKAHEKSLKNNRVDLADLPTFTIDGKKTRCRDDAMSWEIDEDVWKLHVHIADISEVLPANSKIDVDAKDKLMSTYIGDFIRPMLPNFITYQLGSLQQKQPRTAFSFYFEFKEAKLVECKLERSVINVDRNLHYQSDFDFDQFKSVADMIGKSRSKFLESANEYSGLARSVEENMLLAQAYLKHFLASSTKRVEAVVKHWKEYRKRATKCEADKNKELKRRKKEAQKEERAKKAAEKKAKAEEKKARREELKKKKAEKAAKKAEKKAELKAKKEKIKQKKAANEELNEEEKAIDEQEIEVEEVEDAEDQELRELEEELEQSDEELESDPDLDEAEDSEEQSTEESSEDEEIELDSFKEERASRAMKYLENSFIKHIHALFRRLDPDYEAQPFHALKRK